MFANLDNGCSIDAVTTSSRPWRLWSFSATKKTGPPSKDQLCSCKALSNTALYCHNRESKYRCLNAVMNRLWKQRKNPCRYWSRSSTILTNFVRKRWGSQKTEQVNRRRRLFSEGKCCGQHWSTCKTCTIFRRMRRWMNKTLRPWKRPAKEYTFGRTTQRTMRSWWELSWEWVSASRSRSSATSWAFRATIVGWQHTISEQ